MLAALIIIICVALLFFILLLTCFFLTFYSKKRRVLAEDEFEIPKGDIYEPYREEMINWTRSIRCMPHETLEIKSFDGLTLRGSYYEFKKGAPLEILFHGYRGSGERDMCGSVERCFALGRSALIVDQRAAGKSDGHIISFGINESKDCLRWVDKAIEYLGEDVKIILTGISMGASTVVMASGEKLPKNVVGILADCGYSSAKGILKKVIKQIGLPVFLFYPVIRLSGILFGGFDVEKAEPIKAAKACTLPIIFVHGDADDFVPCEMSREMYEACTATKKFICVNGAGHGLAFPYNKESYLDSLRDFEKESGFLL